MQLNGVPSPRIRAARYHPNQKKSPTELQPGVGAFNAAGYRGISPLPCSLFSRFLLASRLPLNDFPRLSLRTTLAEEASLCIFFPGQIKGGSGCGFAAALSELNNNGQCLPKIIFLLARGAYLRAPQKRTEREIKRKEMQTKPITLKFVDESTMPVKIKWKWVHCT